MKKTLSVILSTALFFLASCNESSSPTYGLKLLSGYNGAALYLTTTPEGDGNIKVIRLSGSFTEMGRQYGYLLRADLEEYFDDIVTGYLVGDKSISYADLVTQGEASYAGALAETKEFMQGISETSGLTLEELKVINISMLAAIEACSAVVAWGPHTGGGPLVVGRNWDMNTGSLDRIKDYMMVTVYNPPTGNSVADIHYMGQFQLFQSAINEKNLWVDMQNGSLSSGRSDDSLQDPNAAIFEFLRESSTMEELGALFMAGPASASFIMTVADPEVAYSYFWCTQGTYRFDEDDEEGLLSTSNHFVEYPEEWEINTLDPDPARQMYTEERRANWLALANSAEFYGKLTDETMKSMIERTLEEEGGTFPPTGYAAETIYQIVAVPETLRLWIRLPKYFGWEKVELAGLFE